MAAVAIVMRCKAIGKFLAVMVGQAHVSASESQARIVKDFFSTLTDVKIDDLAAIGEAIEDAGFASADKEMLLGELSGMAQLPLQITPVGMRRNRSMQDYEAACSYGKQSQWVAWRQAPWHVSHWHHRPDGCFAVEERVRAYFAIARCVSYASGEWLHELDDFAFEYVAIDIQ